MSSKPLSRRRIASPCSNWVPDSAAGRLALPPPAGNTGYPIGSSLSTEPTHFQWLRQNLQDNSVDLTNCRLVHPAVTGTDGKICFDVGDPASYDRAIGGATEIDAISLSTLLLPLDSVDLIDMDVQGAELDARIEPALDSSLKIYPSPWGDVSGIALM